MDDERKKSLGNDPISEAARKAEQAVLQDGLDEPENLDSIHPHTPTVQGLQDSQYAGIPPAKPAEYASVSAPFSKTDVYTDIHDEAHAMPPTNIFPKNTQTDLKQPPREAHSTGSYPTGNRASTRRLLKPLLWLAIIGAVIASVWLGIDFWRQQVAKQKEAQLKQLNQKSRDSLLDSAVEQNPRKP